MLNFNVLGKEDGALMSERGKPIQIKKDNNIAKNALHQRTLRVENDKKRVGPRKPTISLKP